MSMTATRDEVRVPERAPVEAPPASELEKMLRPRTLADLIQEGEAAGASQVYGKWGNGKTEACTLGLALIGAQRLGL